MNFYESNFNKSIKEILDMMSTDGYWIHLFEDVICPCVEHTSGNPDPNCKKCLGTGHKIQIKKVTFNSDDIGSGKASNDMFMQKVFYIKSKWEPSLNDMLIDGNNAYYVFQKIEGHGFHEEHIYNKYVCSHKKIDPKLFFKNFKEIVGE